MIDSIRVALPISSFLPSLGGAEVGLHNIALRLLQRGHRPTVLAPAPHVSALRRAGWSLPYPIIAFPPKIWGLMRHTPGIGHFLFDRFIDYIDQKHRFQVWHTTIGYPVGVNIVRYARSRRAIPHFVRCTGEDIQIDPDIGYGMRLNPAVDAQIRNWLPQADRLVAITDSVAQEYIAIGASRDRIINIPNGVDLTRFAGPFDRGRIRGEMGIAPETLLVLCVGRNHPKKNFDLLLRAVARAAGAGTDIAVAFVGKGVTALQGIIDDATRRHVRLIEPPAAPTDAGSALALPSARLIDLYRAADVFALPSRVETFGIVLAEAMAAGLPVITTDAPGCRDVVRAGRDGIVVPSGDEDAFLAALLDMAANPQLRHAFSAAAAARAADFSWDAIVDRYIALYRELISGQPTVEKA